MKQTKVKSVQEPDQNQKTFTWSDLIGVAGYKGPRKSIRELQLRTIKSSSKKSVKQLPDSKEFRKSIRVKGESLSQTVIKGRG